MLENLLHRVGDSDPTNPQLHILVLVFCGAYGGLALVSFVTFGFLVKRSGCVLTRHAVFFFLSILVVCTRILSFGVNAASSQYDPAAFHFAELLPELLFFVGFSLVLLEWNEAYYARMEREYGVVPPNAKLPMLISLSIVVVTMLLLWLLTVFAPHQINVLQWILYGFTALIYAALGIAYVVVARRALSVVSDSGLIISLAIVVSAGNFFRATVLIGFNLTVFGQGAVAQYVLYSLFYLISEVMPLIAGWVCFRMRLPRAGLGAPAGLSVEHTYLLTTPPPKTIWSTVMESPSVKKIPFDELQIQECIGSGSFGRVFRGVWRGTPVAIKQLTLESDSDQQFIADFVREITMMSELRHPHIVQFLGAAVRPHDMCLVTEYMRNGSLHHYLYGPHGRGRLPWPTLLSMAMDCAQGMNYLHHCSPPVIHRDLKTANLLVTDDLRLKVADFGISICKSHTMATNRSTLVGSPSYMAEEVLRGEPGCYSEKCDVFGFAVILWEMYCGTEPWKGLSAFQVISAVAFERRRLAIPKDCPTELAQLIRDCWDAQPSNRPSFDVILRRLEAIRAASPDTAPAPAPAPAASQPGGPSVAASPASALAVGSPRP